MKYRGCNTGQPHCSEVTPSRVALQRWAKLGAALRGGGRLKLRAIRSPGGWLTCELWVREFLAVLTENCSGSAVPPPGAEARAAEATARLEARGFAGKSKGKSPASDRRKAGRASRS